MTNTLAIGIGPWEVAVIALVGLLIFGGRLPTVMKDMAKGIKGFQSELRRTEHEIEHAADVPRIGQGSVSDEDAIEQRKGASA